MGRISPVGIQITVQPDSGFIMGKNIPVILSIKFNYPKRIFRQMNERIQIELKFPGSGIFDV